MYKSRKYNSRLQLCNICSNSYRENTVSGKMNPTLLFRVKSGVSCDCEKRPLFRLLSCPIHHIAISITICENVILRQPQDCSLRLIVGRSTFFHVINSCIESFIWNDPKKNQKYIFEYFNIHIETKLSTFNSRKPSLVRWIIPISSILLDSLRNCRNLKY